MDALPSNMTPLCFDRADFNRPDFNVETFLSALRRRVTFEQIQEDLRLYLKILQNAMIELINQDYADFVNLSSNLVNLRQTVDKLEGDLSEIAKEFESATSELETAIGDLSVFLESKKNSRNLQSRLEERIRIISLLNKLKSLVSKAQKSQKVPRNLTERISGLILSLRVAIDSCPPDGSSEKQHSTFTQSFQSQIDTFQRILDSQLVSSISNSDLVLFSTVLSGYEACKRRDAALAIFIAEFLEPSIQESLRSKLRMKSVEKLQIVFGTLLSLREKYQKQMVDKKPRKIDFLATESSDNSLPFLSDALLTVLLSVLDSHFGSVTIPTDADVFHQCYTAMLDIVRQWPDSGHPLLKMAVRKFSLPVYFRMRCHEISQELDKTLSSSIALPARGSKPRFHLQATVLVSEALAKCWSDSVYLPLLNPRFWDFSCKLLSQYKQWTERIVAAKKATVNPKRLPAENYPDFDGIAHSATNGDHSKSARDWEDLIRLMADTSQLESAVFELAFDKIWPKVRSVGGGDTTKLGECLSAGMSELKKTVDGSSQIVSDVLAEEMAHLLKEVSEVPRQYRWTRKEAPTQPSPYLKSAFLILSEFEDFAQNCFLSQDQVGGITTSVLGAVMGNYLEKVQNVLVSVDKMSTSLSKLKRNVKLGSGGTGGSAADASAMTDDQKIRLQLSLDLAEFRDAAGRRSKSVSGVKIDWKNLEELEASAKSGETTQTNSFIASEVVS